MQAKRVLLIIGGGIAAYKSLELIRLLATRGIATSVVLTQAGTQFVTPLSVSALSNGRIYQDLFNLTDEAEMGHIQLSRSADLVVVAPATADLMGKLAAGLANDLASTALLATDKKILMAPAMNVRMWESPSVRRSLERLTRDGVLFVGPNEGEMACGEFGAGRMAEPAEIVAAIEQALQGGALRGFKALVTAGPTHEALDPVRFIANRSSGRQGYAIADALARQGAETVLISGPVEIAAPANVKLVKVTNAREMWAATEAQLPADIAVLTAAVADWRPQIAANAKIKKSDSLGEAERSLTLVENPDILAGLARHKSRPRLLVGFAAETDDVIAHATAKRARKDCDWIIANDVSTDAQGNSVMGGARNRVHLITATEREDWPEMSKADVAQKLAQRIAERFRKSA